jgi:hypothetical protein
MRHWFLIDRDWVERREALLGEQEDAAIRAARDEAETPEDRKYLEGLIAVRTANRRSRQED